MWSYTSASLIRMEIVVLLVMYFSGTSFLLCGITRIISIMFIQIIVPHNIAVQTRLPNIRTSA